jgi:hypothetical protein
LTVEEQLTFVQWPKRDCMAQVLMASCVVGGESWVTPGHTLAHLGDVNHVGVVRLLFGWGLPTVGVRFGEVVRLNEMFTGLGAMRAGMEWAGFRAEIVGASEDDKGKRAHLEATGRYPKVERDATSKEAVEGPSAPPPWPVRSSACIARMHPCT